MARLDGSLPLSCQCSGLRYTAGTSLELLSPKVLDRARPTGAEVTTALELEVVHLKQASHGAHTIVVGQCARESLCSFFLRRVHFVGEVGPELAYWTVEREARRLGDGCSCAFVHEHEYTVRI